ncbi:MAG: ABC transporter permease [Planctomycetia bacterium]|nr:ABC transporter permease [Planctomycetia bacterium]
MTTIVAAESLLPGFSTPAMIAVGSAVLVIVLLAVFGKIPIGYNLNNLRVRWRTTLMTALAFTLVTGVLTVMLAFLNGMFALTSESGQPGNVIILAEGMTDETFSTLQFNELSDLERLPEVVRNGAGQALVSKETYIIANQEIHVASPGKRQRRFLQMRGVDDAVLTAQVHAATLHDGGRWFTGSGVQESPGGGLSLIEAVIGEGIARELAKDRSGEAAAKAQNSERLDVGDTFEVIERTFVVTGVMKSAGTTFDSEVWCTQSLVGPLFGKERFSSMVVRTPSAETAQKLKNYLNNEFKAEAVNAQVETEYFAGLSESTRVFLIAVTFLTVVIAVGGIFGVMNTMFAAISQRSQDVGVLRLLGFKRRQVLVSFLLESLLIAVIGGAVGCGLGFLADGWQANSIVTGSAGGGGKFVVLRLIVDGNVLATGMVLSVSMGFLGGLLPSLNAMRLSPLAALR